MFSGSPGSGGQQDREIGRPAPEAATSNSHQLVDGCAPEGGPGNPAGSCCAEVREDGSPELRSGNQPAKVHRVARERRAARSRDRAAGPRSGHLQPTPFGWMGARRRGVPGKPKHGAARKAESESPELRGGKQSAKVYEVAESESRKA